MIPYRPDIDGLRAVAVILVLIFHAFPEYLTGGFIGVDVFFVISGFLISKIIFTQVASDSFSLLLFYQKRVLRIFPALITVLVTCLIVGWLYLLPDELRMLGKHVLGGAFSVENILYYRESGYFDVESQLKPLLHLWSLGIEEQFYLFWPVFIIFFFKRPFFASLLLLITGLSFYYNIANVEVYRSEAYYLPFYRFWELALGGVLAYFNLRLTVNSVFSSKIIDFLTKYSSLNRWANCASLLGIIFILYGAITFHEKITIFPGWAALLPTLGAILIIAAAQHAWINRKILSHKGMVFIGLISYPLYLWHWPILVFNRLVQEHTSIYSRLVCILVSLCISWITYHFIEKNLRPKKNNTPILLSIMVIIGGIGFAIYKSYIPSRSLLQTQLASETKDDWVYPPPSGTAELNTTLQDFPVRVLNPRETEKKVLLVGDSNMEQYYPRAEHVLSSLPHSPQAVFLTGGGCPPIPDLKSNNHSHCKFANKLVEISKKGNFKKVVICGLWHQYFVDGYWYYFDIKGERIFGNTAKGRQISYAKIGELIKSIKNEGIEVSVILNIPIGVGFNPRVITDRSLFKGIKIEYRDIDLNKLTEKYGKVGKELREVVIANGGTVIDPWNHLCNSTICPVTIGGTQSIYKDNGHLTASFSKFQATYIDPVFLLD